MKKIILSIIILFSAVNLYSHKVNIFYYIEYGTVFLETYFSDGVTCKNSEIKVYNATNGKLVLDGKTDENGKFQFKIPGDFDLRVVLIAEMGHRCEVLIKINEILNSNTTTDSKTVNTQKALTLNRGTNNITIKDIDKLIEKRLKPVLRELALLREDKPTFSDIVGGIGYIFGIFGIVLYFMSRKNND